MLLQTLDWDLADLMRRFFDTHNGGKDGLEIAAAAEKAIIRLMKAQKKSIEDFFSAM